MLKSSGTNSTIYPNSYYEVDGSDVRRHITADALGNVATSTWNGTDSTTIYHHKDHLGGTHVETDESGAAVQYVIYKPFGETLVDQKTGTYENDRKYTGKELDSETSWYYYGARYYDPTLGRFMSQDPVFRSIGAGNFVLLTDPQALNSYGYARNNPILYVDPDGRLFERAINFGSGFLNAWFSNNVFGLGRVDSGGRAYQWGLAAGDAAALVQGAFEVALGLTTAGAGVALDATGVGAVVGVPATVAGTTIASHGATVAGSAILNSSRGAGLSGSGTSSGGYRWANEKTLADHFERHGGDFGAKSAGDYTRKAQEFYQRGMSDPRSGIEVTNGNDGMIRMYDAKSNTFGSYNGKTGETATFFKPEDGVNYWKKQLAK